MGMPVPIANPANSTFNREIGGTPHHAITEANTNATVVHAGPATVMVVSCFSDISTVGWLKLHDTASTPVAGATPVVQAYLAPASLLGNGFVLKTPIRFNNGVAYTFTGASADSDASSGPAGVAVNIVYRGE
jgi:hypothetical protein